MQTKAEAMNFQTLLTTLKDFLAPYNIGVYNTDLFEHAMLLLGNITENPGKCKYMGDSHSIKKICMQTELPRERLLELIKNLNEIFGEGFCDNEVYPCSEIRFSLAMTMENIDTIKETIQGILAERRNLLAYQRHASQRPKFESLVNRFDLITKTEGISTWKTDCVELVLLKMFGCEETLTKAQFNPGKGFVKSIVDTEFFLTISENAAKALVEKINQQFGHLEFLATKNEAARFVEGDFYLLEKGNERFSKIVIDTGLLESRLFLSLFQEGLVELVKDCVLADQLRVQSGTQSKPTTEYVAKLETLATNCKIRSNFYQTGSLQCSRELVLSESLSNLAETLRNPEYKSIDRRNESDNLRRSIAFFESTQIYAENKRFKQEEKADIKTIQRELRLR